jgi:hypothetical protein
MRRYVIERDMPGIGSSDREAFKAAAQRSNEVLADLAPEVQWIESYVTGDKIYCVYVAENEGLVKKHADLAGFPANKIAEVKRMIDPTTATMA